MAKKPATSTLPEFAPEPAIQVSESAVQAAQPTLVSQTKPAAPSLRLARLVPVHGYPIRHLNGGIVFYPGQPSAEVPVDAWLEVQIKEGILREV